ncbi:MAG: hypothetical protein AAF711_01060 [Planctomycetota bacterium]
MKHDTIQRMKTLGIYDRLAAIENICETDELVNSALDVYECLMESDFTSKEMVDVLDMAQAELEVAGDSGSFWSNRNRSDSNA